MPRERGRGREWVSTNNLGIGGWDRRGDGMLSRTRSNAATSKSNLNTVHCLFDSLHFGGLLLEFLVNAGFELAQLIHDKILDSGFDFCLEVVEFRLKLSSFVKLDICKYIYIYILYIYICMIKIMITNKHIYIYIYIWH